MQTEESTLSEGSTIHCNGGREGEGEWEEEGGSLPPIRKAGVIGDKSKVFVHVLYMCYNVHVYTTILACSTII